MHCSSRKSVERTKTEAGLDAIHFVGDVDGMQDSKSVNSRYCPMTGYEAVFWAFQSWTVVCCHMLGMSFQDFSVANVFHRAV